MGYLKNKPGSIEEVIAKQTALESGYQDKFKKELEKTGRGIGSMTPKEKSDFFNKIDKMHKAKNETYMAAHKEKPHKEEDAYDKDDEKPKTKPKKLKASYGAMKASYGEEKEVPKGSHKMPDGTIMKDSEHKKEVKEADDGDKRKDDPCWKGYKMVGMKNKGGKEVPNCVPMSSEELEQAGIELSEVKQMPESCGDCGLGDEKCKCEKENKESTMTGKKETEIDTEPKISYNK